MAEVKTKSITYPTQKDGTAMVEVNGYKYKKIPDPYDPTGKNFVYIPAPGKKDPAFEELKKGMPGNDSFINQTSLERLKDPEYLKRFRDEAENDPVRKQFYKDQKNKQKIKEFTKSSDWKDKSMQGLKDDQLQRLAERIHKFETQKGSADGTGLTIDRYARGKAKDVEGLKKLIQDDYFIPMANSLKARGLDVNSLSEEVLFELTDYAFNSGREVEDLLTYALGEASIDELKGNTPTPDLSKASELTIEDIYKAKDDAYKTTYDKVNKKSYTLENPNPAYEKTWKHRIGSMQEGHDDFSKTWSDYNTDAKKVSTKDKTETTSTDTTDTTDPTVRDLNAKSYIGLVEKYKNDPTSLSNSEVKSLQKYINTNSPGSNLKVDGIVGEGTIDAISDYTTSENFKQRLRSESSSAEREAVMGSLETMGDELKTKNNALKTAYKEETDARQELKTDVQKKTADAYNVAKIGVDTAKMLESYRQIKAGKEAQRELAGQRPQMPTLRESEDLASATQRAQARANQGLTDRALSAIRHQDIDDYSAQQAAINSAAAGQSGVYGSLMSKGGVDALKRNILLGQADQAAQAQNEMQAAQLAQARANELSTNQQLGLRYGYQPQLEEWQLSKVGARETERAGRLNLARQQQMLPYTIGNLANQYYRRDEQTAPSLTGYNDPRVVQAAERTMKQNQAKIAKENSKLNEAQHNLNKKIAQTQLDTYKAMAKPRVSNADKISAYIQGDEAYPSFIADNPFEETNNVGSPYKLEPIVPYK